MQGCNDVVLAGRVAIALIASVGLIALGAPATASASGLSWSSPQLIDSQAPYTNPASLSDLSCPSTSLCVATDSAGNVATSTNPTGGASAWTTTRVDDAYAVHGISCPTTSLCVATDSG